MKRAAALASLAVASLLPAAAFAAEHGGGEEHGALHFFWEWLNAAILVAVLVYYGRKPVAAFLSERKSGIVRDLDGADRLLRESEARLAEWNARAARIDADVADIHRLVKRAAENEAARIIADARAAAERIRRDAASAVEREATRARARLRGETAELAVDAAEKLLREQVQPSDADRLFDELVARIERPAGAGRS